MNRHCIQRLAFSSPTQQARVTHVYVTPSTCMLLHPQMALAWRWPAPPSLGNPLVSSWCAPSHSLWRPPSWTTFRWVLCGVCLGGGGAKLWCLAAWCDSGSLSQATSMLLCSISCWHVWEYAWHECMMIARHASAVSGGCIETLCWTAGRSGCQLLFFMGPGSDVDICGSGGPSAVHIAQRDMASLQHLHSPCRAAWRSTSWWQWTSPRPTGTHAHPAACTTATHQVGQPRSAAACVQNLSLITLHAPMMIPVVMPVRVCLCCAVLR
jgi:hypothetical protein